KPSNRFLAIPSRPRVATRRRRIQTPALRGRIAHALPLRVTRLSTQHSALSTQHSALATRHSPLATRHSPLATRFSLHRTLPDLLESSLLNKQVTYAKLQYSSDTCRRRTCPGYQRGHLCRDNRGYQRRIQGPRRLRGIQMADSRGHLSRPASYDR